MKIEINTININYEVHGKGTPIILLHGNSENHKIFDKLIQKLKDNYKVYAIDNRCHGESDNTSKISYELMADDIIKFIHKLHIDKPILYGFSDGGIVGLLIAIKEPELLSRLIISGANISPDAVLARDLNKIKIQVHILVGEKDVINLEHTKLIKDNIEKSTLEIIENENHGSYIVHSEKLYEILKKYI